MALTPSTMLDLGTPAPDFALPSTSGKLVSLDDVKDSKGLLVIFMCNHCPYVIHIKQGLIALANDYMPRGLAIVGINSNDTENYPADSFEKMIEEAYPFDYLLDETQETAKAYRAACTPDFFLFDSALNLAYRGQFDSSRPNRPSRPAQNVHVTGEDLRKAIDEVLSGRSPSADQKPSMGCNIKWKPNNEPDYFS